MITEEEKDIAFDFIILNLLLAAIEVDIKIMVHTKLKLKNIHLSHLDRIHHKASQDLATLKRVMNKKGIKVLNKEVANQDFWRYQYLVRGYESEFRCFRSALKMHTEKKFSHYVGLNNKEHQ